MKIFLILFLCLFLPAVAYAAGWEKVTASGFHEQLTAVKPGASALFLSSDKNLYRIAGGSRWETVLRLDGMEPVRKFENGASERFYLVTGRSVLKSTEKGRVTKIFSRNREGFEILSVSEHPSDPEIVLVGTTEGLYWSTDGAASWTNESGLFGREKIASLIHHPALPEIVFAATEFHVYASEDYGKSFKRVLAFSLPSREPEAGEEARREESLVRISPKDPMHLVAAGRRRIFESKNLGRDWKALPEGGFSEIRDLQISSIDGTVYAAAGGVFALAPGGQNWTELHDGILEKSVDSLAVMPDGKGETVYALTGRNLYKWPRPGFTGEVPAERRLILDPSRMARLETILRSEPTVLDIQNAVIRYANVKNVKTRGWQWGSRLKPFVPEISIGKSLSRRDNVDIDRAGTNQPDEFIFGPDSKTRSSDLSLDWNLGDVLFSSDQTSIDSREKLMVELRNDLVSEATRLYFERRRLLLDLFLNPPEGARERMDLTMRIEELTGYLDGLTGGFLSAEIARRGIVYA